jgi:hypothetical protein
MKEYNVTLKNGSVVTVPAARFESDGSGARFFDEDDQLVASWADGQVAGIVDSAFAATPPAEE